MARKNRPSRKNLLALLLLILPILANSPPPKKSSFIRQINSIGAGDVKLIATIMASVQLTESTREEGTYPINNVKATDERGSTLPQLDRPVFEAEKQRFDPEGGLDILA